MEAKIKKKLIKESYAIGILSFGKYPCMPAANKEFMQTVPNCAFGDSQGCKLRANMYQNYIDGWTFANLNQ